MPAVKTKHAVIAATIAASVLTLGINADRTASLTQRFMNVRVPNLGCVQTPTLLKKFPLIVYINDSKVTYVWGLFEMNLDGVPNSFQVKNITTDLDLTVTKMTSSSRRTLEEAMLSSAKLKSIGGRYVSIQEADGVLIQRADGGFWLGVPGWGIEFSSASSFDVMNEIRIEVGPCVR